MTASWRNFFFASFDPGGFITVDKPPVALWFQALSVRTFGYSSWTLLLPGALAGTASVAILFSIMRRHFGAVAATIAALVLAVSPVSVSVNRLNLPEPFMILFLVAASWAVLRSLDAHGPSSGSRSRWFAGLALNTKTLAAAIAFPRSGSPCSSGATWKSRVIRGAVLAGVAALASAVVGPRRRRDPDVDASVRRWSRNNTELNLLIGYNGLGRVDGEGQLGAGGRVRGLGSAGGIFGGQPGKLRLLSDAVGSQIGWLLPLAVAATLLGVWTYRKRRHRLAAVVLWSTWFWLYAIVFSEAKGSSTRTTRPRWRRPWVPHRHRHRRALRDPAQPGGVVLRPALTLGLTVATQRLIMNRAPEFHAWAQPTMLVLVTIGVAALFVTAFLPKARRFAGLSLLVIVGGFLIGPAAWASSEVTTPVLNATLPQAGPRIGLSGTTFGSAAFDPDAALADFLRAERHGERWDVATTSAMTASGLIAQDDISVMAMGGFLGSDPATSVAKTAELVKKGEVRFFLAGGGFPRFGGPGGFGGTINSTLQGSPNAPSPARPQRPQTSPGPPGRPRIGRPVAATVAASTAGPVSSTSRARAR
jgi:4-amino-4-deoxy-L-arabinose transferase-like glycosyltransferase